MSLGKILPPRVPLTDPRTGLISREWFLFFQSLYVVVGSTETSGAELTTLVDSILAAARPQSTSALTGALNELTSVVLAAGRPANDLTNRIDQLESELQAIRQQINTSHIKKTADEIGAYVFGAK